jgi:hypothetical protein
MVEGIPGGQAEVIFPGGGIGRPQTRKQSGADSNGSLPAAGYQGAKTAAVDPRDTPWPAHQLLAVLGRRRTSQTATAVASTTTPPPMPRASGSFDPLAVRAGGVPRTRDSTATLG